MIGDGQFNTQLHMIDNVLRKLRLVTQWLESPNRSLGAADFRGKNYREQYNLIEKELAFDFKLKDLSFLCFRKSGVNSHDGMLSYCYYEAPVSVMSYDDFVGASVGATPDEPEYTEALTLFGGELMPEYEQYVTSQSLKEAVTPLRYDYLSRDYRPGIHPASHMHFGFGNDIRVGTKRVMTPMAFLLFVLRQTYPDDWVRFQQWEDYSVLCRNVRDSLDQVHEQYWAELDLHEVYLM